MPPALDHSILIGTHVLNLQAVAHFSRVDHHAAGKVTRVEFIGGEGLECFNAEGNLLWQWAAANATKLTGGNQAGAEA